jgi:hypothetical protein
VRRSRVSGFVAVAVVLVALVAAGVRLLPGSPLAAKAAARWETPTAPGAAGSSKTAPTPSSSAQSPSPSPSRTPELPPISVRPADVQIDASGWWSWALLDRRTGKLYGSTSRNELSTTASLIKSWIAADYLRRAAEDGDTPSDGRMEQLRVMIRDSDNEAAESLYNEVGRVDSIERLLDICKLKDSEPSSSGGWSRTMLSPADITRLGACIADGRAAGPKWTDWLLKEMRAVRGTGDFGIRKAFPAAEQKTIAIKNGWVDRQAENEYHVSCLAIGDNWTIGVMARYEINKGYPYGAEICEKVGEQLRVP